MMRKVFGMCFPGGWGIGLAALLSLVDPFVASPQARGGLQATPQASQTLYQPVGTTFTFFTPGDFTGRFSQPLLFLQNGLTAANIRAMQGASSAKPDAGSLSDVITCGQLIPAGAGIGQANCYSAFQRIFSPINPVGFYSREEPAADGITEWGSNLNLSDRDDVDGVIHKGTTIFAQELDVNVTHPSTAGAALLFGAIFVAQPGNMGAIHLPLPNLYNGNRWNYGFMIDDGAVSGAAISLGATEAASFMHTEQGDFSAGSQTLQMTWHDRGGRSHTSTFYVNRLGTYHMESDGGAELDRGDLTISNGSLLNRSRDGGIELGSVATANTPYMDFHSSGHDFDYDARIIASGGSSDAGQGRLQVVARALDTPALTVARGIGSGTGLQHVRVALGCSTRASFGATCTSSPIRWSAPFADKRYTLSCSLEDVAGVPAVSSVAKTASSFTVTGVALTASVATGTADCIAMHDAP